MLATTWVLLVGAFVWSLTYLAPTPAGRQLTIDELSALATQHRISSAEFRDEDAQIVGSFACTTPPRDTKTVVPAAPLTSPTALAPQCQGVPVPVTSADSAGPGTGGVERCWVFYPKSDSPTALLLQLVTDSGARASVDPQTRKAQVRVVATLFVVATTTRRETWS